MKRTMSNLAALLALPSVALAGVTGTPFIGPGAGDGGLALRAYGACSAMAYREGAIYMACPGFLNAARRVDLATGTIEPIAGTYTVGTNPVVMGADALSTPLNSVSGVAPIPGGYVYVAAAPQLYRVTPGGVIDTVATVSQLLAGVSANASHVYAATGSQILVYHTNCVGGCAPVRTITVNARSVWVSDDDSVLLTLGSDLRQVNRDGSSFRIAGGGAFTPTGPMAALDAKFISAQQVTRAPDGTIYVADAGSGAARVYAITGSTLAPFAGTGSAPTGVPIASGQDCLAIPMRPDGIAVDQQGRVYINGSQDRRGWICAGATAPPPTVTSTSSPVPTNTVALTSTPTRTATAPPTATRTLVPTATATRMPTATATVRTCDAGEAPSCLPPS